MLCIQIFKLREGCGFQNQVFCSEVIPELELPDLWKTLSCSIYRMNNSAYWTLFLYMVQFMILCEWKDNQQFFHGAYILFITVVSEHSGNLYLSVQYSQRATILQSTYTAPKNRHLFRKCPNSFGYLVRDVKNVLSRGWWCSLWVQAQLSVISVIVMIA